MPGISTSSVEPHRSGRHAVPIHILLDRQVCTVFRDTQGLEKGECRLVTQMRTCISTPQGISWNSPPPFKTNSKGNSICLPFHLNHGGELCTHPARQFNRITHLLRKQRLCRLRNSITTNQEARTRSHHLGKAIATLLSSTYNPCPH